MPSHSCAFARIVVPLSECYAFFCQSDCLLHAGNAQKEDLQKKSLFTGIRGMVLIWSPLGKKSPEMISRCIYGHYRTRSSLHPLAFCQEECDEQPEHVVHLRPASQRRATSIPRHCRGSEYRWKELISEKKGICESALYVLDIPVMQVAITYTSWPPSPFL